MAQPTESGLTPAQTQAVWQTEAREKAARAFMDTPVLVYTMGKVGSSTIYDTLLATDFADRVFHLHSLRAEGLAQYRELLESGQVPVPNHVHESEAILEQMRTKPDHPIKIITLVRDPVAREISAMFENRFLARHVLDENLDVLVEQAINHLTAHLVGPWSCDEFFKWFDLQPRDVFGIDIFDTPFPKEQGWHVYRKGAVEMLLVRLEDLSRVGPLAVAKFLEQPAPIELVESRVRREGSYQFVRAGLKLPTDVCSRLFNSPMMIHLYSDAEIAKMISRWRLTNEDTGDVQEYVRNALLENLKSLEEWATTTIGRINADRAARLAANQRLQSVCSQLRQQVEDAQQRNAQRQIDVTLANEAVLAKEANAKYSPKTSATLPSSSGAPDRRSSWNVFTDQIRQRIRGGRRAS